jgi:type II secretory pathway pseudopilin PulG
MTSLKNEQGYALVTVLMVITIFMIVLMSFMGQAFSSVKQNQVVEKNSQSVAAAEMGVSLYQVTIQDIFEKRLAAFKLTVPATQTNFRTLAATEIAQQIQSDFLLSYPKDVKYDPILHKLVTPPENPGTTITNKEFSAVANGDKINITFVVLGTENDRSATLEGKMSINLNEIAPTYNAVKKPISPNCTNFSLCSNILNEAGHKELLISAGTINAPNNMVDKVIYSTGNLTVIGPVNNMDTVNIRGENLVITGNVQNATDTNVEANGDLTIEGHFTPTSIKSTNFYVGGKLTVKGNYEIAALASGPSYALIRKSALVTGKMAIGSNYSMCIKGDLTVEHSSGVTIADTGNLYITGNVIGKVTGRVSKVTDTMLDQDPYIRSICGNTFDPPKIETLINSVDYK